jgi:hypothetical protein
MGEMGEPLRRRILEPLPVQPLEEPLPEQVPEHEPESVPAPA